MFQLDQSDLDFGIYRIMNYKRDEIEKFLNEDLLPQVKSELEKYTSVEKKGIDKELKELTEKLKDAGVALESSSKYVSLKSKLDNGLNVTTTENEIYSHLANFFRRYYSDGDFISLRRYKKDVYALPYEGEEIKLHWANSDQYYIKTAEYFRDYSFTTPDDSKVHFKLIDAETEKDNIKSQKGKERRFVIIEDKPMILENGELTIRFEYVIHEKKQKDLNNDAVEIISQFINDVSEFKQFQSLLALEPTEKNPKRTVLEKYLNDYTSRNTFDYFIHKNLGDFLRRELDFYIKNEVMFLDDIDIEDGLSVEQYLTKIRVIKLIGSKIITFLEQVENFQKRLWLKKKFVTETNYCMTLDKVPEELYVEIINNSKQIEEWNRLFAIEDIIGNLITEGYSESLTIEFLKQNQYLVIDTSLFNEDFKERLISSYDNLDEQLNGLLINSENFQALNLLNSYQKEIVDILLWDPPYNTKSDKFLYKDGYKHSSWLSMLSNRLDLAYSLLKKNGVFFMHIDENEHINASFLLTQKFGLENRIGDIVWKNSSKNDENYISVQHEYIVGSVKDKTQNSGDWNEIKEGLDEIFSAFNSLKEKYGSDWKKIHEEGLKWYNQFPESNPIRNSKHYNWMDERGVYFASDISGPNYGQYRYDLKHPITGKVCKEPASGWRFPETTMTKLVEENRVHFGEDETTVPKNKTYLKDTQYQSLTSIKYKDGRVASKLLESMFNGKVFSNPKDVDLEKSIIKASSPNKQALILDAFAGSGTTAHSIIELNKEEPTNNYKYILIEMGAYFDEILKPRIQKAIYSKDWKNGKPVSREGSSHIFKYIRLESYEDTLNNLLINKNEVQMTLLEKNQELREQYILSYMLNNETENSMSLLNIDMLKNPFDYSMNIANGLETQITAVDLVETFNYLMGIKVIRNNAVEHYNAMEDKNSDVPGSVELSSSIDGVYSFKEIEGRTLNGDKILIIWRTLTDDIVKDNAALDAYFLKKKYSIQEFGFNRIYVNGDNNLQNLKLDEERWKVVLIEEEFKKLMFDVQNV